MINAVTHKKNPSVIQTASRKCQSRTSQGTANAVSTVITTCATITLSASSAAQGREQTNGGVAGGTAYRSPITTSAIGQTEMANDQHNQAINHQILPRCIIGRSFLLPCLVLQDVFSPLQRPLPCRRKSLAGAVNKELDHADAGANSFGTDLLTGHDPRDR